MSSVTTTLKLPEALKTRIAQVADAAGKTPHAFMVEALQAQTDLAEKRREFVDSALLAREEVAQYGLVYDADEVFSYIQALLEGKEAVRPAPTRL
jgi:predicted transcriptional regulator